MLKRSVFPSLVLVALVAACGTTMTNTTSDGGGGGGDNPPFEGGKFENGQFGGGGDSDAGSGQPVPSVPMYPELWYCVDQLLVRVELNADGTVKKIQPSTITLKLDSGSSAITMLKDGSLLVSRLSRADHQSHFFHIPNPPRDGSDVTPTPLGVMPDGIMIESLYTDCKGRLYAMDTGTDESNANGNRLLRLTGNIVAGDYTFVQVSDLSTSGVPDIDDMGPSINSANKIVDNPGLAIDTGRIYTFDYETGKGTEVAQAGTFGIYALGGSLFGDSRSRLYVMNEMAEFFELNPTSYASSSVLGKGPKPAQGVAGWSSLAGPLTDCAPSGFVTQPK